MIWWQVWSDWLRQVWNDWLRDGGQVRSDEDKLRNAVLRGIKLDDEDDDEYRVSRCDLHRAKDLFTDEWFSRRADQSEGRNPNIFRDEWFCDGCYFSEDGCVIYKADGKPFAYFNETCNTFQSDATGRMVFYYDLAGEQLWPARRA